MMEDLNLYRAKLRILYKCWIDKEKYKTVDDISAVTKLSTRTITRFAKDNNFPKRSKKGLEIASYNKLSF